MLIFAHRGASGYAPENTIAAFDLARRMGATGIETDVRLSRDGVLVLVHDKRVDRTSDGTGRVADLTWVELARLDAGAWFDPRFTGERIVRPAPFLERYLGATVMPPRGPEEAAASGEDNRRPAESNAQQGEGSPQPSEGTPDAAAPSGVLTICLEVKAPEAVDPLVELLRERRLTDRADLQLTSFNWDAAVRLHAALSGLVAGFLTPRFDLDEIDMVAEAGLAQICPRANVLDPDLVVRARERGLQVRAWGVGTREEWRRVVDCDVDGTTLNWPNWAHEPDSAPGATGPAGDGA